MALAVERWGALKAMSPTGFELVASGGLADGNDWILTEVSFGHSGGWKLVAEFDSNTAAVRVTFDNPATFRVTDEGDLLNYWASDPPLRGLAYTIPKSGFLDWFAGSTGGLLGVVRHYLLAGSDHCLEVLSNEPPRFEAIPFTPLPRTDADPD